MNEGLFMFFRQYCDPETCTFSYFLGDTGTQQALVIDPVLEWVERDMALLSDLEFSLAYSLETHVHADHITGSGLLRERLGCKTGLSKNSEADCADLFLEGGASIEIGGIKLDVLSTPGHTDTCLSFYWEAGERVFTGDALLVRGCGRTDFQGGDPETLYKSIHEKLFTLPENTIVMPGHDYKGRTASTIGEEIRFNPRLGQGKTAEEFIDIMNNLKLAEPDKLHEALPANKNCGNVKPV